MKSKQTIVIMVLGLSLLATDQLQAHKPPPLTPSLYWAAIEAKAKCPTTIKGRVVRINFSKKKLIIRTHGKSIKVFELGPRWYWQRKGITRLRIGEKVKARVIKINTPKGSYLVACAIKTRRWRIQLRDPRTGLPLWVWWRRTCMRW